MQPIDINTKSWHYRLAYWSAVEHGPLTSWEFQELDLCAYIRTVIGSILKALYVAVVMSIVVGGLLYTIGLTGYQLYRLLFLGTVDVASSIGAMLMIMVLTGVLAVLVNKRRTDERRASDVNGYYPPPKEPGFITQAYRSWKGKYCTRVNFVTPCTDE